MDDAAPTYHLNKGRAVTVSYTGDPRIDQLIKEWTLEQFDMPQRPGDWAHPRTLSVAGQCLPDQAWNTCNIVSSAWTDWMIRRGYGSFVSIHTNPIRTVEVDAYLLYPDAILRPRGRHYVNRVQTNRGVFFIDWSSAQYGYLDVPTVTPVDDRGHPLPNCRIRQGPKTP